MRERRVGLSVYRALLRLYPAGFRENYAAPLERDFLDESGEARGAASRARLWLRIAADLAVSAPLEWGREAAQDAWRAVRRWRRRPWRTGFALAALAIGIGASTGVFSVVDALLLRALPFRDPDRLVSLRNFATPHDSAREFHQWRGGVRFLADAALTEPFDVNLGGADQWRRVRLMQTSWNFFSLLGAKPALGRTFAAGEDEPGRNQVAVIGYGLWREMFGGDPKAVGATVRVDGAPLIVVGVAAAGFDYPGRAAIWRPGRFTPGNNGWSTIARLAPGVTWTQAREAFTAEAERLAPGRSRADRLRLPATMASLRDELAGPAKRSSLALMACVALILLIACANIAHLLLADAVERAGEFATRIALGAGRARLAQQLLTECVLLALAGAGAGIAIATAAASLFSKLQPAPLASQAYDVLDLRVLAFATALAAASGLLFGILPALYAASGPTAGARVAGSQSASRLREALLGTQVAVAIVLLAASLSAGRAFFDLARIDRGFDARRLVTVNVSLEGTARQSAGSRLAYFQQALARIRRLPGVQSASATEFLPLHATDFIGGRFRVDGQLAQEAATVIPVLPDYFRTMGGRMLWGREFTDAEMRADAHVAVVNERFAAQFGRPSEAIGREISIGRRPPARIVGVATGMDYLRDGLATGANFNQIFLASLAPGGFFSSFVARVNGRPEDRLAMVRDAIQATDPSIPVFGVKTMEQRLAEAMARPRFYGAATAAFAAFALLLAAIGVYGLVSRAVAQRTREMGVRLALGATPARLRSRLLGRTLWTVALGAGAGIVAAAAGGRLMENFVEGSKAADAGIYAVTTLVIAAVAAAGVWAATRPIARLDVAEILRAE
jgi:predicted permease